MTQQRVSKANIIHIEARPEWFDENGFMTGALTLFEDEYKDAPKGTVLVGTYKLPWGEPAKAWRISNTVDGKQLWVPSHTPPQLCMMTFEITRREIMQQTYYNLWGCEECAIEDLFPAVALISDERIDLRMVPAHVALDKTKFTHTVEMWSRYYVDGEVQWKLDREHGMRGYGHANRKFAPTHLRRYVELLVNLAFSTLLSPFQLTTLKLSDDTETWLRLTRDLVEDRLTVKHHTGKEYSPVGIWIPRTMAEHYSQLQSTIVQLRKILENPQVPQPADEDANVLAEQLYRSFKRLADDYDRLRGLPTEIGLSP